jgi:MFS family permease
VVAILRSNAPLRRLLGAWLQSCVGTGAGYVALLLLATRDLHTSWAVAAVLVCDLLPSIALGFWFGGFADRYSKRRLIVVASLMQALAFGGLALAHSAAPILLLALLAGVGNAMQLPALRLALPALAGEDTQVAAAIYDTCRWVGVTVGPAVSAALFVVSGVALPLALNGLSFLLAAGVIATIAIDPPAQIDSKADRTGVGAPPGLKAVFASPLVVALFACSSGTLFAGSLLNVSEPFLATHVLHGSGSDYALLVAAYGVGMVVAAVLVARGGAVPADMLIHRYIGALVLTAVGMFGSALVGSIALAALTFAATGVANALLLVSQTQLILLTVPSAVQGRLFGAKNAVNSMALLLGLAGAGALVVAVGVRVTLATGGAICGVCALAAAAALLGREPQTPPDNDVAAHARTGFVDMIRSFP